LTTPYANLEGVTPLVSDRYIITLVANSAITMGQLLYITGADFNCAPAPGTPNLTTIVGVALKNQPTTGKTVSVATMGIVRVTAWGSISRGDQICSASGGTAGVGLVQSDTGGAAKKDSSVIGIALQAISSGATGLVLLF